MLIHPARSRLRRRLAELGCILTLAACGGEDETPDTTKDPEEASADDGSAADEGDDASARPNGAKDVGRDAGEDAGGQANDAGKRPELDASGAKPSEAGATPPVEGGAVRAQGCTESLLPLPEDPGVRGPWDVGVRTVKIGRLTAEIMYPAKPGSTAGKPETTYDPRDWLPENQRELVPVERSKQVGPIGGHLYRDVPIDDAHGPYPVVVFIHGTASFRIASGTTNVHWASRGFVVIAADYPGLGLSDKLKETPLECNQPTSGPQDIPGDVKAQIDALTAHSGDLAFLGDRADMKNLGISGHSQGGCVTAELGALPNVKVLIPMSGSYPAQTNPALKSIFYISGIQDKVIGYDFPLIGNVVCPLFSSSTLGAYEASPGPPQVKKRVVGIEGGGHLVVTDLCQTNAQGRNPIDEAAFSKVCGVQTAVIIGLPNLNDCGTIDWQKGLHAVNYASTAALEESLHCLDRTQQFAEMQSKVPEITQFKEPVK